MTSSLSQFYWWRGKYLRIFLSVCISFNFRFSHNFFFLSISLFPCSEYLWIFTNISSSGCKSVVSGKSQKKYFLCKIRSGENMYYENNTYILDTISLKKSVFIFFVQPIFPPLFISLFRKLMYFFYKYFHLRLDKTQFPKRHRKKYVI